MTESPSQSDKFKALAKELKADEDEARWDERLRIIATRNPKADDFSPEDGPPATD
jgi:hypothetical protein